MKRLFPLALLIVTASAFAFSSADAAVSRENRRLHAGKITRNEAQHLVLRQFPGAKIGRCTLARHRHHSVWLVDVVKPGGTGTTLVRVDSRSGKILP